MDDHPCPRCRGEREQTVLAFRGVAARCEQTTIPCPLCRATGTVSDAVLRRLDAGDVLRQARVEHGLTLAAVAAAIGLRPVEVSRIEFGLREMTGPELLGLADALALSDAGLAVAVGAVAPAEG